MSDEVMMHSGRLPRFMDGGSEDCRHKLLDVVMNSRSIRSYVEKTILNLNVQMLGIYGVMKESQIHARSVTPCYILSSMSLFRSDPDMFPKSLPSSQVQCTER